MSSSLRRSETFTLAGCELYTSWRALPPCACRQLLARLDRSIACSAGTRTRPASTMPSLRRVRKNDPHRSLRQHNCWRDEAKAGSSCPQVISAPRQMSTNASHVRRLDRLCYAAEPAQHTLQHQSHASTRSVPDTSTGTLTSNVINPALTNHWSRPDARSVHARPAVCTDTTPPQL